MHIYIYIYASFFLRSGVLRIHRCDSQDCATEWEFRCVFTVRWRVREVSSAAEISVP